MRGLSSAHLANSRAHLDCARAAAAGALQSHRTALVRATLYLNRQFSGNSPRPRSSDAPVVQQAVSISEWDSDYSLDSDRRSEEPPRRDATGSWGAGRWGSNAGERPAASSSSGSGWGDDWDLGSDRRTQKSDQRGGRGRGPVADRVLTGAAGKAAGATEAHGGGRGSASSGGSWGRDGGTRPGRDRRDESSAAASEDSWNSSSTGGTGARRGVSFSCPTLPLRAVAWLSLSLC